jgi:Flp pilus assembly protein TadD
MTPARTRTAVLGALLAAYALTFLPRAALRAAPEGGARFDPLTPQGRHVEEAIETARFADALPGVLDLQKAHPNDPQVLYWLAETYRGLDRRRDEAAAWESYIQHSSAPQFACPSIGESYARAGNVEASLGAFERCATYDPQNPQRLMDLGAALAAARRIPDAVAAYRKAAALDPLDPRPERQIHDLQAGTR